MLHHRHRARVSRLLALIALLLAFSPCAALASVTADIAAHRTSCTAPCYVAFSAMGSSETDGSVSVMHDIMYEFEYGEVAANPSYSAVWGDAWGGEEYLGHFSKDRYFGAPWSAHVYETPGTYTAKVTAYSPNASTDTDTVVITVSNPDTVFSGTNTICVYNSSVGSGCPGTASTQQTSDWQTAASLAVSGKRVLLKRGDTFTVGGTASINGSSHVQLGAYGSGAKPKVTQSADSEVLLVGSNLTVMDIEFVGPAGTDKDRRLINATAGSRTNTLLLRLKTGGGGGGIGWRFSATSRNQISIVDCDLGSVAATSDGSEGGKILDGEYANAGVMGNRFGASPNGFTSRLYSNNLLKYSFNYFSGTNNKSTTRLQAGGNAGGGDVPTENFVFSYNSYAASANESGGFRPPSTSFYNVIRNYIVEGNFIPHAQARFRVFGQNWSVRNNIKRSLGSSSSNSLLRVERNELSSPPDSKTGQSVQYQTKDGRVYNNTCYFTGSVVTAPCIESEADVAGPNSARLNLIYAPNAASVNITSGPFSPSTGNVKLTSGQGTPFVSSAPGSVIEDYERLMAYESVGADPLNGVDAGGGGAGPGDPPAPGPTDLEVTGLVAYKTSDDSTLYSPFTGGAGQPVSNFPGFALCATVTGSDPITRVDFVIGGTTISDTTAPYCLSDTAGDYTQYAGLQPIGSYTIASVTPYDDQPVAGVSIGPVSVQVVATAAIEIDHLEVYLPGDEIGVDAPLYADFVGGAGQPLDLQTGFCVAAFEGGADASFVESMRFWITPPGGSEFVSGTESLPPYAQNDAAADGICTQFDDIALPGIYAFRGIPYTANGAAGIAGTQLGSIDLHVVDGTPPPDPPAAPGLSIRGLGGVTSAAGASF